MKKSLVKYLMPAVALGIFAGIMVIYSVAFTPVPVQKQKVILYKFKEGVSQEQIEKHLLDYKQLKRQVPQIIDYSAGYTYEAGNQQSSYDVMHYLTFKTDADVEAYLNSDALKAFQKSHNDLWEDVLIINSEIK